MKLNELSDVSGAVKQRKRVGRGIGSGYGKTCGRGVKGQKSRSGVAIKGFEGGQMPIYRRLPKRGFNNLFSKQYSELNLKRLAAAIESGKVDSKKVIDDQVLIDAGIFKKIAKNGVRVIGDASFDKKVTLKIASASKPAIALIEKAGGKIELPEPKAD
jgi:large subunit ribosomal protein L15